MKKILLLAVFSVIGLAVFGSQINEKSRNSDDVHSLSKKEVRLQKKFIKERGKHRKWMRKNRRHFLHSEIHKKAY